MRIGRRMRTGGTLPILALAAVMMTVGCRSPLPRTPSDSPDDALTQIIQRTERIQSLSARAIMTIRSREGEAIRLRVALAAKGPNQMRLRAWKLGHAALDMTIRGEDVWLWTGGEKDDRGEDVFGRFFGQRRLAWHVLRGGVPDRPGTRIEELTGSRFRVAVPMRAAGNGTLIAEIDRPTLTVREYRLSDGAGQADGAGRRIRIPSHQIVGDSPLPAEIRAEGERGTITLELDRITPNPDLSPAAFQPPARATKLRRPPTGHEPDA